MLYLAYIEAISQEDKKSQFVKWLLKKTKVSDLPEFVSDECSIKSFEFFAKNAVLDLLLFCNNWQYYFASRLYIRTTTGSRRLRYYDSMLLL